MKRAKKEQQIYIYKRRDTHREMNRSIKSSKMSSRIIVVLHLLDGKKEENPFFFFVHSKEVKYLHSPEYMMSAERANERERGKKKMRVDNVRAVVVVCVNMKDFFSLTE